ncbi:MAG: ATP-binding cassette domain-containing protein [Actinomycetota bacterium]
MEFVHDGYAVRPLDGLTFTANAGEIVMLLGPSGSGKTTLLSCLGGMVTPTSGSIRFGPTELVGADAGERNAHRRDRVGFVFQAFNLVPSLSARENVATPLMLSGWDRRRAYERADAMLDRVGLADRRSHQPSQLSGGQQQRVAIARALANDPPVLLADEPTASLDHIQAEEIIRMLRELRDAGRIIIVSSHDTRIIPIADRVVQMVDTQPTTGELGPRPVSAGTSIFEQGDPADVIYTIDDGEIDIVRVLAEGGEEQLARLGPGAYFGELGPLLGFPRSASARAHTDSIVVAHDPSAFRSRLNDEDG